MDKFVPYEKLSKSKKRELNSKKRNTWGTLNPGTRKIESKKRYNRKRAGKWKDEYFQDAGSFFIQTVAKNVKKVYNRYRHNELCKFHEKLCLYEKN